VFTTRPIRKKQVEIAEREPSGACPRL
jgi:hypothetical protein